MFVSAIIDECLGNVDNGFTFREFKLCVLKIKDTFAKGFALFDIVYRCLKRA